MLEAITLKLSMMNKFFFVACCYFLYELIINGLIPTFDPEQDQPDPYTNVIQQFYDLFIISCLLFIFRPRKWPEFFGVGLLDNPFGDDGELDAEDRRLAPLLTTVLNDKVFNSYGSSKSSSQFNSTDPVVIVNPFEGNDNQQQQ